MELIDRNKALERLSEMWRRMLESPYEVGICVGLSLAMDTVQELETVMEVNDNGTD